MGAAVFTLELPASALASETAEFCLALPAARSSTFAEIFLGAAEEIFVALWVDFADGAPPCRFEANALSVAYVRATTRQLWAGDETLEAGSRARRE